MDSIMTMTPAASLRVRFPANGSYLTEPTPTRAVLLEQPATPLAGSEPFFKVLSERFGKRRPRPSRFSPLSCEAPVS